MEDINKQFVSYEVALKLKEIGFDEPCLAWSMVGYDNFIIGQIERYKTEERFNNSIQIPLWEQTFDWFRDVHNIHSYINNTNIQGDLLFHVVISSTTKYECGISRVTLCNLFDFATYQEAKLECLNTLIDIVKNKEND